MAKYINRDKLLEAYGDCIVTYVLQPKNGTFPTYGETALWDYIETMPTIEAEPNSCEYWDSESHFCALRRPQAAPVKHGRWVNKFGDGHEEPAITGGECSICGYVHTATNYCPNCGAKMTDEVEE